MMDSTRKQMMDSPRKEMIAFLRRRIGTLFQRPDSWGLPESVESQLLLLIQMEHVVMTGSQELSLGLVGRYRGWLDEILPGIPASLSVRLGLVDRADHRFVELLSGFVQTERYHRGLQASAQGNFSFRDVAGSIVHRAEA